MKQKIYLLSSLPEVKKQQADILKLVSLLKEGNQKAVSKLYDAYSEALYGVIYKIVGKEDEAQDILQDTFVTIWKKIKAYDETKGSFFTWMMNIARNKSIDQIRKNKRIFDGQDRLKNEMDNGSGEESINVNTIGLKELTNEIDKDRLDILELVYFKGYTQKEVSEELEIPLGTVKTRVRLGLKELRKFF